jgi:predicted dinucleotide-binding enzyme
MKIGILGTGVVGTTHAAKLAALGHDVMIGTRDPVATAKRAEKGQFGNPSFSEWQAANPKVRLGTFAEAAQHAELVVNALGGVGTLEALDAAGPARFAGKVVIDISNPLDFSRGFPPFLSVSNTDSLGEQVQKKLPDAKVVKTLNTVNAYLMVEPKLLANGDHTMFVCGNDAGAKTTVSNFLREQYGWQDIIDLGDITMSRGTEAYVTLWARIFGALQKPMFSVKVVR